MASGAPRPPRGGKARKRRRIGWREWVALPALGVAWTKAKVDTGARTSSLHAYNMERFRRGGRRMVRFELHPFQRSDRGTVRCEAEVVDERSVRTSSGHAAVRPVVRTEIELLGERWAIELTLASRDAMGFRMLLGRQALRRKFVVDPGRSFVNGVPPAAAVRRKKRRRNR